MLVGQERSTRWYCKPIQASSSLMGLFYCPKFGKGLLMCDLSNAEVFNRWKQCKTSKRLQAADYWYNFMLVRAKYGDKQAQGIVSTMDRLK